MSTDLKRIYSYAPEYLFKLLETESRKKDISKSEVLKRAMELYFSNEAQAVRNNPLLRRLDHMSREQDRLRQRMIVMAESHALFVRYFLTLVPPAPAHERKAAKAAGITRFEDYRTALQTILADKNKHLFNGIEDVFLAEDSFFTEEQLDALEVPTPQKRNMGGKHE